MPSPALLFETLDGGADVQGNKTHEQLLRTLEHKDDVPKRGDPANPAAQDQAKAVHHPEARQSEFPVSRGGLNQESRQHNKHNNEG